MRESGQRCGILEVEMVRLSGADHGSHDRTYDTALSHPVPHTFIESFE